MIVMRMILMSVQKISRYKIAFGHASGCKVYGLRATFSGTGASSTWKQSV